jgi:hypothetical protein
MQLSPEYRKAEPGMFNLLFGAYGKYRCRLLLRLCFGCNTYPILG